ncbi:MAG: GAF domain-containing protein [Chloroflexi bacterium]|nr:GAF domain-containing protein [Chloroflexota bacterium]
MFQKLRTQIAGSLRIKASVLVSLILVPLMGLYIWYDVQKQGNDFEKGMRQKAEIMAATGAKAISHILEDAIATNRLTQEQVFDTNYQLIPNTDPAKYHTLYDSFTDSNLQGISDSYLGDPDVLFAVAVDVNGYLPTHDSIYSKPLTGDYQIDLSGNRTKRMFNDTVGLAAAQNIMPILFQEYHRDTGELAWDISAPIYVNGQHWGAFRIGLSVARIATQRNSAALIAVIVGILLSLLVFGMVFYIIGMIIRPISALSLVATSIANGDYDQTVAVTSNDEIGILAVDFNNMTVHLKETLASLEARTRALATSSEVSRRLSAATSPSQLATDVVEQVQAAFNYYHAHIYFLDEDSGDLLMAGGTGEAGATMLARGHRVPKGRGLVGRAAATNEPVLVPDVLQAVGWLPNPLLPDTRSEIAVPISAGNQVLGVLDVQQNIVNGLAEEDVTLLQSLAGQVAISLQNVRSFEQSRAQADLESLVNSIGQKIQRATTVEDTLQTAIREIGLAMGASRVSANIHSHRQQDDHGTNLN